MTATRDWDSVSRSQKLLPSPTQNSPSQSSPAQSSQNQSSSGHNAFPQPTTADSGTAVVPGGHSDDFDVKHMNMGTGPPHDPVAEPQSNSSSFYDCRRPILSPSYFDRMQTRVPSSSVLAAAPELTPERTSELTPERTSELGNFSAAASRPTAQSHTNARDNRAEIASREMAVRGSLTASAATPRPHPLRSQANHNVSNYQLADLLAASSTSHALPPPSTALPSSTLPSSALPSSALPASAFPSSQRRTHVSPVTPGRVHDSSGGVTGRARTRGRLRPGTGMGAGGMTPGSPLSPLSPFGPAPKPPPAHLDFDEQLTNFVTLHPSLKSHTAWAAGSAASGDMTTRHSPRLPQTRSPINPRSRPPLHPRSPPSDSRFAATERALETGRETSRGGGNVDFAALLRAAATANAQSPSPAHHSGGDGSRTVSPAHASADTYHRNGDGNRDGVGNGNGILAGEGVEKGAEGTSSRRGIFRSKGRSDRSGAQDRITWKDERPSILANGGGGQAKGIGRRNSASAQSPKCCYRPRRNSLRSAPSTFRRSSQHKSLRESMQDFGRRFSKSINFVHSRHKDFEHSIVVPNLQFTDRMLEDFYTAEFVKARIKKRVCILAIFGLILLAFQLWFGIVLAQEGLKLKRALGPLIPPDISVLVPTFSSQRRHRRLWSDVVVTDEILRELPDSLYKGACVDQSIVDVAVLLLWVAVCFVGKLRNSLESISAFAQLFRTSLTIFFAQGMFYPCARFQGPANLMMNGLAVATANLTLFNLLGMVRVRRAIFISVIWLAGLIEVSVIMTSDFVNISLKKKDAPQIALFNLIFLLIPCFALAFRFRSEVSERETLYQAVLLEHSRSVCRALRDDNDELQALRENVNLETALPEGVIPSQIVQVAVMELRRAERMAMNIQNSVLALIDVVVSRHHTPSHSAGHSQGYESSAQSNYMGPSHIFISSRTHTHAPAQGVGGMPDGAGAGAGAGAIWGRGSSKSYSRGLSNTLPATLAPEHSESLRLTLGYDDSFHESQKKVKNERAMQIKQAIINTAAELKHRVATAMKLLSKSHDIYAPQVVSDYQGALLFHAMGHPFALPDNELSSAAAEAANAATLGEVGALDPLNPSSPLSRVSPAGDHKRMSIRRALETALPVPPSAADAEAAGANGMVQGKLESAPPAFAFDPLLNGQPETGKRAEGGSEWAERNLALISGIGDIARKLGTSWNLDLLKVAELTQDQALLTCGLLLVSNIVDRLEIEFDWPKWSRFLAKVESEYSESAALSDNREASLPYHNRTHAAIHGHITTVLLSWLKHDAHSSGLESLAILTASLCHDLAHPGFSNAFIVNAGKRLAMIYNDIAVLENLHACKTFEILQLPDHNFLNKYTREEYRFFRRIVIELILATDMKVHTELLNAFKLQRNALDFANWRKSAEVRPGGNTIERDTMDRSATEAALAPGLNDRGDGSAGPGSGLGGEGKSGCSALKKAPNKATSKAANKAANKTPSAFNSPLTEANNSNRMLTLKIVMKAADLSHGAFLWDMHYPLSMAVTEEFWAQGDAELQLGLPISPLCDRTKSSELTKSQTGFLQFVVHPLFAEIAHVDQSGNIKSICEPLIVQNIKRWQTQSAPSTHSTHSHARTHARAKAFDNLRHRESATSVRAEFRRHSSPPTQIEDEGENEEGGKDVKTSIPSTVASASLQLSSAALLSNASTQNSTQLFEHSRGPRPERVRRLEMSLDERPGDRMKEEEDNENDNETHSNGTRGSDTERSSSESEAQCLERSIVSALSPRASNLRHMPAFDRLESQLPAQIDAAIER